MKKQNYAECAKIHLQLCLLSYALTYNGHTEYVVGWIIITCEA